MSDLQNVVFQDETKAREWLSRRIFGRKALRCPHCGVVDEATLIQGKSVRIATASICAMPAASRSRSRSGRSLSAARCRLNKWLAGDAFLMMASKKGHERATRLHRIALACRPKRRRGSCAHRLRAAMADGMLPPLGGEGKVEIDETYIGGKATNRHKHQRGRGRGREFPKAPVFALVERERSRACLPCAGCLGREPSRYRSQQRHQRHDDLHGRKPHDSLIPRRALPARQREP